ncbi:transporter substrate-binding domain-containing protein [Vibrio tubiashii]|uniref:HD domain-containing phosphohydrolase n=1 Tax=Vibrio tubiashii TaxID=29498 RepID=UPI001EFCBAD0|nr:HD domain-containing phosphohydrolase [Vibrio tubiashii]MCG9582670.1 transporter substrate-binding domain-containing protein [Vibrio tubiashii]MCG9616263.1 transporter substrate-binding domain-containing protein [Vibrio tubiashii]MCG9687836.1 transporter substrate-binding domain-containing protein [Vibrio tubiashii]
MKDHTRQAKKFSIQFTVGTMFLCATLLTASVAIGLQYYFSKQMSEENVLAKLSSASSDIGSYLELVDKNATNSVQILKSVAESTTHTFAEAEICNIFTLILEDNPLFYSLYVGRDNDDFYQIINLESSPIVREKIEADLNDRWVVINISGSEEQRIRTTNYLTKNFKLTKKITEVSNYFPTQRPWYLGPKHQRVFKTEPYLFQHLKITGQTYSIRTKSRVIGVDIVHSAMKEKMMPTQLGLSPDSGTESFVFNDKGEVIASNVELYHEVRIPSPKPLALSDSEKAEIEAVGSLMVSNQNDWGPYDYAQSGEPKGYVIDLLNLLSQMTGVELEFVNGFDSVTLSQMYRQGDIDLLHSVPETKAVEGVRSATLFSGQLAVASNTSKPLYSALADFSQESIAVVGGYGMKSWLLERVPTLNITEVASLDEAKQGLATQSYDYIIDTFHTLSELNELSNTDQAKVSKLTGTELLPFHFYMKKEHNSVVDILDKALLAITPEQRTALKEKWLDSNQWRGTFLPYPELFSASRNPSLYNKMVKIDIDGRQYFIYVTPLLSEQNHNEFYAVVLPENIIYEQVWPKLITSIGLTVLVMMVLLPLAWKFSAPIVVPVKALRLETKKIKARDYDAVSLVNTRIKEVSELSESIASMGAALKQHEKQQEDFVESFIKLIAQAIDDKSPYTAGHCNRVPELGMMLAKAAEECQEGKFKQFKFENDDERREFRIAAWLHDCGKITTPEHVVDKGTKLEANYNRIHEIRMRFEVLWRDAEIEYLNSQLASTKDKNTALAELKRYKQILHEEFEFIARSNVGGEFMGQEEVERIKQIAGRTWQRNFDDRLGLSPFEDLNKPQEEVVLPTTEPLLSDKLEHIQKRIRPVEFDEKFGIKMDVPEHQYNLGEVYNLSISRGTLTAEDRFKINEHMISGIKMLEALPFPKELSRVPRYASTHHETLKGTGYPRRLSAQDLSIPERVLVIADIFEALTAADRPYKKAKPVSVAIDILYKMALDEHVDMDLFLLFLESGVYMNYAQAFLPQSQIDDVDINQYFSKQRVA